MKIKKISDATYETASFIVVFLVFLLSFLKIANLLGFLRGPLINKLLSGVFLKF